MNTTQPVENAAPFGMDAGLPSPQAERSDALGKYAKSVDKYPPDCGAATGPFPAPDKAAQAREARWELKRAVERLLPRSRTACCCRSRLPKHKDRNGEWVKGSSAVTILQSKENGSTFYGGVETCGSVWCCPLCAAKISERRRQELMTMQDLWESRGGKVALLTLTFPHGSHDVLSDLNIKFSKARKKLFSSRCWRKWSHDVRIVYKIYALEVTYGAANGWHVHMHCALFIMPTADSLRPQARDILSAWQHACTSSGLGKPNQHGVDLRDGEAVPIYMTKWGLELELTKQHTKRGSAGHSTPFDLLRQYADGDERAGLLFREFAQAFKGKRLLILSPGMRKALDMGPEKTDQELAQEELDKTVCLATLTIREWSLVLKYEFRFALLEEARLRGAVGVRQVLGFLSSA